VKQAIRDAMAADPEDLRTRMSRMRRQVEIHDVDAWAKSFLDALETPTA
jgi:trehalose 6-phosphate synthase